jgi:GT2 family glycosyltransferase
MSSRIQYWAYWIRRGATVCRRDGFVELARRVHFKVDLRFRLFWQKLRLRRYRHLRAQTIEVAPVPVRPAVQPHAASVDLIVCVHNALEHVQACLESILRCTTPPYRILLVDDGSAPETCRYLAEFAQRHGAELIRNDAARGYTRAANQALACSSAEYAVLLNSDTVVTPGWLDRMIACAETDPRVGLVGPLSNTASWQSIPEIESGGDWAANPLPNGTTVEQMGALVAKYSARLYPAMPFLNGFCLLIRRGLIREIGLLDEETFGRGYGEENDYALRARRAGWQLALADDAYVYHAQSQSYLTEARKELAERANVLLAKKHDPHTIDAGVAFCRSNRVLEGIRARSRVSFARQAWIDRGRARFAGRRVLFILPIMEPGGGGNVVVREATAMREMGVDVGLFNLVVHHDSCRRAYPDLELPVHFGHVEDLPDLAARFDAVVATANITVEWLASIPRQANAPVRGYYVQDFEPYMYPAGTPGFHQAMASYTAFPDLVRFAKTDWTQHEVESQAGVPCTCVGVSVDLDLFRPRPRSGPEWPDRPLRVAAMVRVSSAYREPGLTMELLRRASRQYGVEILIFGSPLYEPRFLRLPHDFPWRLAGVLNPQQVASLLNTADIFVDFSSFQAMGLTALEAMACGNAVAVPARGGATSFAKDGENSLVVDTSSPEACWQALVRLIEDDGLRARLQRNALADVCAYAPEGPAYNILNALFHSSAGAR